ncbi:DUF58 domain-containing protein [soil metagenome]
MSPTPLAAWLLGASAVSALLVPWPLALFISLVVVGAAAADAFSARREVRLSSDIPGLLARGVPVAFSIELHPAQATARLRQPAPPDLVVSPAESPNRLCGTVTALRRGRHLLPAPALRIDGPLRLGRNFRRAGEDHEVLVYPDLPEAWRLARAVRTGRLSVEGRRPRGPLGLGTDFESIRDYQWDDDIRQVNWSATVRMGRPMSNQYRVEQDRDVICVVDAGRLMGAPLGGATRLDIALDAVAALCFVADQLSDHCGAVAFDSSLLREISPRRKGARTVVRALFDLEPSRADSDYELAFRAASQAKRSFVVVLTDLLEEAAARPLIEAVPLLAGRHAVLVASPVDTDVEALVSAPVESVEDAYAAAAAIDVLEARRRAVARLRASGAEVVQAPPRLFAAACVESYLRAKQRARL